MSSAADVSRRGQGRADVRRGRCFIRPSKFGAMYAVCRKGWLFDDVVDVFAYLWQAESIANAINEGRRSVDSYNGWAVTNDEARRY